MSWELIIERKVVWGGENNNLLGGVSVLMGKNFREVNIFIFFYY